MKYWAMKNKLTFPHIVFGVFALIIIGLGVGKYLQNQEAIAKWDLDHVEEFKEIRKMFDRAK